MNNNNNVCIVGPSKRFLSGISYYTIRLANSLATEKSVSVICFRQLLPTILFPGKSHIGKEISTLNFLQNIPVFDGMDYNNPLTWLGAYRFLNKHKPDVIIIQWWTATVIHMQLMLKLFGALTYKPKIVIEFHEVVDPFEDSILPISVYAKITGKLLRAGLPAYITHSESDKFLVSARYQIPKDKIHVIPHGLYDQYGKPIDRNEAKKTLGIEDEYVILSFGLIRKYKGITFLIEAFDQLPRELQEKTRLLIVGEIWEGGDELRDQIGKSLVHDMITIVDTYIPDDKVNLYFSAANVVVLPYTRASQSGVAHIAMSFGRPIIVSEVGGLKESMASYSGTRFVEPYDVTALRENIKANINDTTFYEAPEQTWDEIKKKYIELIESV